MPVAALTTLGCKVNQYETEKIAEDFARAGFALTDFDSPADVYIINSCSVTDAADRKSRYLARKAARTNPDAVVVMTGCHSQTVIDRGESVEGATLLVPNHEKMATLDVLLRARPEALHYSSSPATQLPVRGRRTRATLKVQDGCEHYCGFCQIPYTRKVLVSRHWRDVLTEAQEFVQSGVREIVVTGVCVGAYGEATGSGGPDLARLLALLASRSGVLRMRLSSIQPIEVTDGLIDAYVEHPALCPHLHLSCQSGDDSVLASMNRPYSTDFYRRLADRLRARIPDVAITTDLIVGYPGETRAMHENTLQFAQDVAFQRTHVFRYSPRPDTRAAELPDDVTDAEKKRRHAELQAVVEESNRAFTQRYVGHVLDVLVENSAGGSGELSGHAPNYIRVAFPAQPRLVGSVVSVRIGAVTPEGDATGEVVGVPSIAARPATEPVYVPLKIAA